MAVTEQVAKRDERPVIPNQSRVAVRRRSRDLAKRAWARFNLLLERAGVRIEPVHYYSSTPSRRDLRSRMDQWARPLPMTRIAWDLDEQLGWVREVAAPYVDEVAGLRQYQDLVNGDFGPGYGPIESLLLHCVVRTLKPERIIEIGSGLSTMVSKQAADRNAEDGKSLCQITCVEPYPRQALLDAEGVELISRPLQSVPLEVFGELGERDILFVDSSHAVKAGSELARIYLEILPSLKPGVVVHIHDICLPYSYTPDVLSGLFDWQETTLLTALLVGNDHLKVAAAMSALHHARAQGLSEIFGDYQPQPLERGLRAGTERHFPSSTWLFVS